MGIRPLLLMAILIFLTACGGTGYNRSYIISDVTNEEVSSDPNEKR